MRDGDEKEKDAITEAVAATTEEATPAPAPDKPKRVRKKPAATPATATAANGAAKVKAKIKAKAKAPPRKAATKKATAAKKAATGKPEQPTGKQPEGLRGEIVGARTGTAKDLVATHLILNAKKQLTMEHLSNVAYPGKKGDNTGALKAVLNGIKNTLLAKKLNYVLKSERNEKKEWTIGLYPVR